jgi:antitoxin component YwqK of YwqJK toxin-antitoxin module
MTPVISYYPDGTLKAEEFVLDNIQVGNWTFYHDNGELFTKGQM